MSELFIAVLSVFYAGQLMEIVSVSLTTGPDPGLQTFRPEKSV
jgi:hypothetical protein